MVDIARKTKRYPTDLTDEEWVRIEPLMPKPPKRGRKIGVDLREMLNAIRYMARSGGGCRLILVLGRRSTGGSAGSSAACCSRRSTTCCRHRWKTEPPHRLKTEPPG